MKRSAKSRKHRQKRQRTRKQKTQRGGNIMSSVKPPKEAVLANPIETDGGYKFEYVSMP